MLICIIDQIEKVDFIEPIIQEHVDRKFMEDPIERALVWSDSHEQLESECVGCRDPSTRKEGRDTVMYVGQWTLIFEPLVPNTPKPVPSENQPLVPKRIL